MIDWLGRFEIKKLSLLFILKWLAICGLLGLLIGSASAVFLKSLAWAGALREQNLWLLAFLPLAGLLIGLMYHYYGKEVASGNNLLIDTLNGKKERIPPIMAPMIYLATIVTHVFGGSAGREGTALQMGGSLGDLLTKPLKLNETDRKILIIAAIAAGFGSVFGTPLAGAVFALECYIIGKITHEAIFPAFLASILANLVCDFWQIEHAEYLIRLVPPLSFPNILYAILVGIICGICAVFFIQLNKILAFRFNSLIHYPPLRPFVGGLLLLGLVWIFGTSYIGLGLSTISAAFTEHLSVFDFLLKIIFTALTLSAGFKGGEVTPLFFIGAALGNALAIFIPLPVGLLAGMGLVAIFAGATNTPLACIVLAFELFGSESAIYMSIACVVAYLVSGTNSIYSHQVWGSPKTQSNTHLFGGKLKDF